RASVEAVDGGDDLVFLGAEGVMRIATCQLERRLVGFGAGVTEKGTVGEGRIHQLFRQAQRRLIGEDIGDVPELASLLGQRLHQRRVCMPEHVHGNASGEVDQLSPALIPYSRALAAHRNEGGWSE